MQRLWNLLSALPGGSFYFTQKAKDRRSLLPGGVLALRRMPDGLSRGGDQDRLPFGDGLTENRLLDERRGLTGVSEKARTVRTALRMCIRPTPVCVPTRKRRR